MAAEHHHEHEESLMEKIADKIHGHDSSSDSDNDNNSSSVKSKVYRLFGRETPLHKVFGSGKPADIFLWRNKKTSGAVLGGATVIPPAYYDLLLRYGLFIVGEVQLLGDGYDDVTRYLVLAREPIIPGTDRPYKTSIVLGLENRAGVVFKALAAFAFRNISLSKIESLPQKRRSNSEIGTTAKHFEYVFYLDFEASMADIRAQHALFELLHEYHLLTLVCHCLILALTVSFLWANGSHFINKSSPRIPEVHIPEDSFMQVASELRKQVNCGFAALHNIALGKDLKMFLSVLCTRAGNLGIVEAVHVSEGMGSVCCVAARDGTILNESNSEILRRNARNSPSWSFRWDNRGRVAGEEASVSCYSNELSRNDGLENKSENVVETAHASEAGSPAQNSQSLTWKSPLSEQGSVKRKTHMPDSSISRSLSMEVSFEQLRLVLVKEALCAPL